MHAVNTAPMPHTTLSTVNTWIGAPFEAPIPAEPDPALISGADGFAFALGSNVGASRDLLIWAGRNLARRFAIPGTLRWAPLYLTAPISPIDQDPFLNTVVLGRIADLRRSPFASNGEENDEALDMSAATESIDPEERELRKVLGFAKHLERAAGRRPGPQDGPRPLDVDLLFWRETSIDLPAEPSYESQTRQFWATPRPATPQPGPWPGPISVPHPRMTTRRFVLAPLADLAPRLRLAGQAPVEDLLQSCADQEAEQIPWSSKRA